MLRERSQTLKTISAEPKDAPANTLGIRRIMFAVDDIEDVVARLRTPRRRTGCAGQADSRTTSSG
jgi:hypothetical protein